MLTYLSLKTFSKPPHSDTFLKEATTGNMSAQEGYILKNLNSIRSLIFLCVNLLQQKRERFAGSQPTSMARFG